MRTYTKMCTAELFLVSEKWEQSKCPSGGRQKNKRTPPQNKKEQTPDGHDMDEPRNHWLSERQQHMRPCTVSVHLYMCPEKAKLKKQKADQAHRGPLLKTQGL